MTWREGEHDAREAGRPQAQVSGIRGVVAVMAAKGIGARIDATSVGLWARRETRQCR